MNQIFTKSYLKAAKIECHYALNTINFFNSIKLVSAYYNTLQLRNVGKKTFKYK